MLGTYMPGRTPAGRFKKKIPGNNFSSSIHYHPNNLSLSVTTRGRVSKPGDQNAEHKAEMPTEACAVVHWGPAIGYRKK